VYPGEAEMVVGEFEVIPLGDKSRLNVSFI